MRGVLNGSAESRIPAMELNTEKNVVPTEQDGTEEAAPAVVRRRSKTGILVVAGVCILTLVMLFGLGESIRQRTESRTPIQAKTKRRPPVQRTEPVAQPSPPRKADPPDILD